MTGSPGEEATTLRRAAYLVPVIYPKTRFTVRGAEQYPRLAMRIDVLSKLDVWLRMGRIGLQRMVETLEWKVSFPSC